MYDLKDVIKKPAFTEEVLQAWEFVAKGGTKIPPTEKRGPNSIPDLINKLYPIRQGFQFAMRPMLAAFPPYQHLHPYMSKFWGPSSVGPTLKGYIWNYAAVSVDKGLGRLQHTFLPNGDIRSEYVTYAAGGEDRYYHIDTISNMLQHRVWVDELRAGLESLPEGWKIECKCGDGRVIDSSIRDLVENDWTSLSNSGLDTSAYFIIAYDRPFQKVGDVTVEELAELVIADWADLSGLYPLLQGAANKLKPIANVHISDFTQTAREVSKAPPPDSFTPEFEGELAEYNIRGSVKSTRIHGKVVNTLSIRLRGKGLIVVNDKARDLAILDPDGKIETLIEVKTDISTSSIYTAVGQLMLHSSIEDPPPRKILVVPANPTSKTRDALSHLSIEILTYDKDDDLSFRDLDEVIQLKRTNATDA